MDIMSVYRDAIALQTGAPGDLVNEEIRDRGRGPRPALDPGGEHPPHRRDLRRPRADDGVQHHAAAGARVDDGRAPDPLSRAGTSPTVGGVTPPRRTAARAARRRSPLLLSGCGSLGSRPAARRRRAEPTLDPEPGRLDRPGAPRADAAARRCARFYDQKLTWKPCRDGDRVRHADRCRWTTPTPTGRSIRLAGAQGAGRRTQGAAGRVAGGQPGRPGRVGRRLRRRTPSSYFGARAAAGLRHRRASTRAGSAAAPRSQCLADQQLDALRRRRPRPGHPGRDGALRRAAARSSATAACARAATWPRHMSTVEVAKDLDVLRAALGDRKLSLLRRVVRHFHRGDVRRAVPAATSAGWCSTARSTRRCRTLRAEPGAGQGLRDRAAGVRRRLRRPGRLLPRRLGRRRHRADPAVPRQRGGEAAARRGGRELDVGNAVLGIWLPLYSKGYWAMLDTALQAAFAGDGALLLALADAYVSRGPTATRTTRSRRSTPSTASTTTTRSRAREVAQYVPRFEKASPTFGADLRLQPVELCAAGRCTPAGCRRRSTPRAPPPIMVVGTTRDPATPLVWAEALADQLDSGRAGHPRRRRPHRLPRRQRVRGQHRRVLPRRTARSRRPRWTAD